MQNTNKYYNYILLDPRKPLNWEYANIKFKYAPFYVGKGTKNRCLDHYKRFTGDNPHKENIIKILNKGGYIPVIEKLNENSSEEEALNNEILIISDIKHLLGENILTNITLGGDEPPHYKGKDNPTSRAVYQYDKDTGEFLKEFGCIREACRELSLNEDGATHIVQCCKGTRRTFATYKWSYEKLERIEPNDGKYDRIKFSLLIAYNDKEYHEFKSMKEAYSFLGTKNKGKINQILKGNGNTYKGYFQKIKK